MRLLPAPAGNGIVFMRDDAGVSIRAHHDSVIDTRLATTISNDESGAIKISTIEHFMSALFAYGIDNLLIMLDNEEIPVMDGSSGSFCMLLEEAGIEELESDREMLLIKKKISVTHKESTATLEPGENLRFDFSIDFKHPVIGKQTYHFEFSTKNYKEQIARARTFGFLHEVQYLRSQGLAIGGSLENAIVLDEKKILNPEGLRFKDEFVRHKILDAIGDLSLIGKPFIGHYHSSAGSHYLNHLLVDKLLSDSTNYEIVTAKSRSISEPSLSYAPADS